MSEMDPLIYTSEVWAYEMHVWRNSLKHMHTCTRYFNGTYFDTSFAVEVEVFLTINERRAVQKRASRLLWCNL